TNRSNLERRYSHVPDQRKCNGRPDRGDRGSDHAGRVQRDAVSVAAGASHTRLTGGGNTRRPALTVEALAVRILSSCRSTRKALTLLPPLDRFTLVPGVVRGPRTARAHPNSLRCGHGVRSAAGL